MKKSFLFFKSILLELKEKEKKMKKYATPSETGYPVCCWLVTFLIIAAFITLFVILITYPYPSASYYRGGDGFAPQIRTNCTIGEEFDNELFMCAPIMNVPVPISHELMDLNVGRCDSFFHHMSGKWIQSHTNENRGFSYIFKRNRKQIHDIIVDPKSGPVYKFYRSCLDTLVHRQHVILDKSQMKHVKEHIMGAFNGHADLPIVFARLAAYGFNSPFSFTIEPHPTEFAMIPLIRREEPFEEDENMLYDLRECLRKLKRWNTDENLDNVDFIQYVQSDKFSKDLISMKSLLDASPPDFWKLYLRELNGFKMDEEIEEGLNQMVWTTDVQFLHSLMHGLGEVSNAEWRAYIEYSIDYNTNKFLPDLPMESYFRSHNSFKRKKHRMRRLGVEATPHGVTSTHCIDITNKLLPGIIGNIYLQKNTVDKTQVTEIVENTRDALAEIIQNTSWLSPGTKGKMVEKIRSIIVRSVRPNYFEQEPFLDRLTMDNYLRNLNIIRRYFATKNFEIWTKDKPNRDFIQRFGAPITEVNAFYSPVSNTITIFAGLLNKPFYNSKFPKVALYAIIGMVSGHELGHAIDNTGRLFDKEGSLSRVEPWKPEEYAEFKNRTKELMKEYDAPAGCMNSDYGEQTLNEDVADHIGVKSAYYAWLKAEGFNVTTHDKQQFFQIFAQAWAETYDQETLCGRVNDDVHAIAEFRVDKTLRQMKEFREVFGCKKGDKMVNMHPAVVYD